LITPAALRRALAHLRRADPTLARVMGAVGPLRRRPGRRNDHFSTLVESIVYQQISGSAAASIYARLCRQCGGRVRPESLLEAPDEALRAAGLSRQKLASLRDLAGRVRDGLPLARLGRMPDEDVIAALTTVRGIGRWTAEMFLIARLGRLDVLPVHDYGIRKAVQRAYRLRGLPAPERLRALAEPWRPYRTVACWYLWRSLEPALKP